MKYISDRNFFEARNEYELLVSILLSNNKYKKTNIKSEIYCTFTLSSYQVKLFNDLDWLKIKSYVRNAKKIGRYIILLRLFFFSIINFLKWKQVYLFHEISPVILFRPFFEELILIEHGEINYIDINSSPYYINSVYGFFKTKLLKNSYIGESGFFDFVYLRDVWRCPEALAKKTKPLCLDDLSKDLTVQEIEIVNRIFAFDKHELGATDCCTNLILTQPFSEMDIMTESDKLKLYAKVIEGIDGKVIIKPHPRERTDYSLYFPKAKILKGSYPVELFAINKIFFDKVFTVNSSGAKNTLNNEIVFIKDELINGKI